MDPENSQALQLLQVKYIFLFNAFNLPNIFTSVNIKRNVFQSLIDLLSNKYFFRFPIVRPNSIYSPDLATLVRKMLAPKTFRPSA
jgi:hypothetical protein